MWLFVSGIEFLRRVTLQDGFDLITKKGGLENTEQQWIVGALFASTSTFLYLLVDQGEENEGEMVQLFTGNGASNVIGLKSWYFLYCSNIHIYPISHC